MRLYFLLMMVLLGMTAQIGRVYAGSLPNQETAFFLLIEDMPLMDGLVELEDESVSFDKPEGRIIESYALMDQITKEQVTEYYKNTMPQFGWGRVKENMFYSNANKESLELSFMERGGKKFLKVSVFPSL